MPVRLGGVRVVGGEERIYWVVKGDRFTTSLDFKGMVNMHGLKNKWSKIFN